MGQAKAPADQAAIAEQALDLLRGGAGGDIEILGLAFEQQVAHGAADQVCGMARFIEVVQHAQRSLADVAT